MPERALAPAAGDSVVIRHPSGAVTLAIQIMPDTFNVTIEAPGALELRCGQLTLAAEGDLRLEANGDLVQSVGGDVQVRAGGRLDHVAEAVRVRGARGCVELRARDDVQVRGERVLLND